MTYKEWFTQHTLKHGELVHKLQKRSFTKEEIIAYFEFNNMVKHEPNFCPLYATNTRCHNIESLNCYWCACPYFRFNDNAQPQKDGRIVYSFCSINAPDGVPFSHKNAIHHDCSGCILPHDASTILKFFNEHWEETMSACEIKTS